MAALGAAAIGGPPWLAFPTVLLSLAGLLGPVIVPSLLTASGGVVFAAVVFHALGNLANEAIVVGSDVPAEVATEAAIAVGLVAPAWRWMVRPTPPRPPAGKAGGRAERP